MIITSEREITHISRQYNKKLIELQAPELRVRLQHGTYKSSQRSLKSQ